MVKRLSFDNFSMRDLKKKIVSAHGSGGFRDDVKKKALRELIKRQKKEAKE